MQGNGSGSPPSAARPNANNGAVPLPPSGPRRPQAAVRMPSCQIQRNWDRGEASNTSNSNTSSASAAAAAAAARRRRAATVASPIREYPPHIEDPELGFRTSTAAGDNTTNNDMLSNNNNFLSVPNDASRRSSVATAPPAAADGHITFDNPEIQGGGNSNNNTTEETSKNVGWGAALMNRGRRRAATTAAALGRTLTGGGGAANRDDTSSTRAEHGGGVDIGDIEAGRRARAASHASIDRPSYLNNNNNNNNNAYDSQVHDMLDVIDPEVQTVNLLGDIQNAFFIPPNRLFDRTRKLQLTKPPADSNLQHELYLPPRTEAEQAAADARRAEREAQQQQQLKAQQQSPAATSTTITGQEGLPTTTIPPIITTQEGEKQAQKPEGVSTEAGGQTDAGIETEKPLPGPPPPLKPSEEEDQETAEGGGGGGSLQGPSTTTTTVETEELILADQKYVKGRYFVLPSKLVDMTDWSDQEKADLDDYVRHLMHNKKEIFRRRLRGFGKYVRTPLGCFVTVYASLLTFWGAAWVLFLIGWLPAGDRQAYFVEICDQILVALFCVTGLGLIPWRIRDTYHAYYIIKYHRKTLKLRKKRGLPKLADDNDLPNDQILNHDLEIAGHAQDAVLNDEEQKLLVKHQTALSKSHTYYRPHETFTHHAFPLSFLIAIIVLCDCHSCFQLTLGSATWSISYHHWYKKILTTIVLCFSLSCNITGGICIAVGSRLSRKKEVVEALLRQAITEEALKRKEDAEKYRAEKRQRLEKEAQEKRQQQQYSHSHSRQNSSNSGIIKTSSFPINAVKNAPQKLKLITQRNNSDPGLSEKLVSNTRRSSSSARSSLDSPRFSEQQQQNQNPSLKRAGSERLVSSPIEEH